MATSIQTIGDRAEVVNDLDLLALLAILKDTATQTRDRYSSLQPFMECWEENCVGYGPGTLDLRLEDIAADQITKSELEHLLMGVEGKLSGFGKTVPTSLLSRCRAPGVTFNDYPTSKIKLTIDRIRSLIQPDKDRHNP